MPSTAVVADTTSYLPRDLIDQHDIKLVSLYVGIEGEQEREADVTDGALELDALEGLRVALIPDQQPQIVAAASELSDDVEADKARRASDERLRHTAGMVERRNALDRGRRRYDLIPAA